MSAQGKIEEVEEDEPSESEMVLLEASNSFKNFAKNPHGEKRLVFLLKKDTYQRYFFNFHPEPFGEDEAILTSIFFQRGWWKTTNWKQLDFQRIGVVYLLRSLGSGWSSQ